MQDLSQVPQGRIALAAIAGAHGVAGEVRLKLFGEGVTALSRHSQFNAHVSGGALTLSKIRDDNKGGAIARLSEVTTREQAEALRGTLLTVSRDALPALSDDEFYHADLIGLAVVTDAGDAVGSVIAVENFGATDVVEIAHDPVPEKGQKSFMVPLTAQAVIGWNTKQMTIAAHFVT